MVPLSAPSIPNLTMRDHLSAPGGDARAVAPGYQTRVPVLGWEPVPGAASYDVDVTLHLGYLRLDGAGVGHWRVRRPACRSGRRSAPAGWGSQALRRPQPNRFHRRGPASRRDRPIAPVSARAAIDSANVEVYGDYTYVDDGTK